MSIRLGETVQTREAVEHVCVLHERGELAGFCVERTGDARNTRNIECCAIDFESLNRGNDALERIGQAGLHEFEQVNGLLVDRAAFESVRHRALKHEEELHATAGIDGHGWLGKQVRFDSLSQHVERMVYCCLRACSILVMAIEVEEQRIQLSDLVRFAAARSEPVVGHVVGRLRVEADCRQRFAFHRGVLPGPAGVR